MVKSTEGAVLLGLTIALTKETSSTTTLKVWEFTTGAIKEFTEVTGRTTKWKAEAFLSGLMAESTMEIGKTGNNTASAFTLQLPAKLREASGMKARESLG